MDFHLPKLPHSWRELAREIDPGKRTKTARKPYDAAVCACLIVLHHHFGKSYSVSSDGGDGDDGWVAARDCCQRVLGYGAEFTLKVPPRMTAHGLAYSGGWSDLDGGGVAHHVARHQCSRREPTHHPRTHRETGKT